METLDPDRWLALAPYLEQALDMTDEERSTWLLSLAAQDAGLAAELESLLQEHFVLARDGFMENSVSVTPENATGAPGQSIGPYTLLSPIGQGGMGSVWLAARSDGRFERQVAVKFLHASLVGQGIEQRFKREGGILGRLAHPHIAELIDAGVSAGGLHYLVLEYVQGDHIDRYCDRQQLHVAARIRLFLDVADAVSHAHAHLIVHRDLKPSNVLVNKDGQVKLLDFGIAKLLEGQGQHGEPTMLTLQAGRAMTPQYAAPEQITDAPVTTATDVYSLGVLLYVLLTGRHPAGSGALSPAELVKAIVDTEAPRLSEAVALAKDAEQTIATRAAQRSTTPLRLRSTLRGDLDTIVAKALKKNPKERYGSVPALAEDLRRYLGNEPISARPDTFSYRAAKFVRRHRAVVALASLVVIATLAGIAGILKQNRTAREQRDFAYLQLKRSHEHDELLEFLLSDAAPGGKPFTVNDLLARAESTLEKQHSNNAARRSDLLMWIGGDYSVAEQQTQARRALEQAYQTTRSLADPGLRGHASCLLGLTLAQDVDLQRGESLVEEGLRELPVDTRFDLERIDCLRSASQLSLQKGDTQKSVEQAQAAQSLAKGSPLATEVVVMRATGDLASAFSAAGRDAEALVQFQNTANLLSSLGWDETQSSVSLYSDWALELDQVGRPLEAEQIYRHVLDVARDNNTTEAVVPMVLTNYARILRELNRFDEASGYASRSHDRAKAAGDELVISQSLLERARIATGQKNFALASSFLSEVEPRLRKDLPPGHYAFAALAADRAMVALGNRDPALARKLSNEAVDIDEAAIKGGGMGAFALPGILVRRSSIALAGGDTQQAVADAKRALTLAQSGTPQDSFSSKEGLAYLALARALVAQGKRDEARNAAVSAFKHLEKSIGPDHPDTRDAQELSGRVPATH